MKILFFLYIFLFETLAFALTIEDAAQTYLAQSPQIQSARELHRLSKADRWRRFLFNEPQFQYLNQDNSSSEVYGLTLPISFPGKVFAMTELDSAKERVQHGELIGKTYETVKFIVQSYLDCAGARGSLKIVNETVEDLRTLYGSLTTMYESGHSTQAERIGAELQLRQTKSDLQATEDKARISCEKLAKILDEHQDRLQSLTVPDDLPSSILEKLESKTADHARAEAALDLAQTNMDLASWSQVPDINLSYNKNHYLKESASPSGEPWTTTYGVSITIPIFFPFHEYNEIKRSKAQALMDQNSAHLQLQQADLDEVDAMREYTRNKARLKEIQQRDLALAETLVDSTFSAYKAGKLGFAELMTSRKTLADLKSQELQLRISVINAHLRCLSKCSSSRSL